MHLYIHIPFCNQKCQYCDFASGVFSKDYQTRYILALKNEIHHAFQIIDPSSVDTVYIGGGTPSSLEPKNLALLYDALSEHINLDCLKEFTIEANPESVSLEFAVLAAANGVSRVSLGVQSANDDELQFLGRIHNFEQARRSVEIFRQVGITNINLDLIFALPGQSIKKLSYSLKQITDLRPSHISCYSLIFEEGTPLTEKLHQGLVSEMSEGAYVRQYRYVIDYLQSKGFRQYEISNFAQEGFESMHNSSYWSGNDYLGLGAAAHSKIGNKRFSNVADIDEYIIRAKGNHDFLQSVDEDSIEILSSKDLYNELIFLGLRRNKGISFIEVTDALQLIAASDPDFDSKRTYGELLRIIDDLAEEGFLFVTDKKISLTQTGREISNTVFTKLML